MEKKLSERIAMIKDMTKVAEPVVNLNDVSRVSEGTVIKGDMSSSGDVRVDGTIEGKLFSEGRIVIGESASILGSILCTNLDFWGKIDGDIYVKDLLTLKSTSVVNGNIHVRKLQVEMGAQVNGTCKMITEEDFSQSLESATENLD